MFNVGTLAAAAQPWTPDLLFKKGEQGVWYDPSDIERYMATGPERLANFDFTDGAANWTVENADATHTITFNAGECRYVSGTTSPILSLKQNNVYAAGSWYEVVVVVSAWVSGSIKVDASGVTSPAIGAVGTHRFTAQATGAGFMLYRNSADVDITISSISVRELTNISTATMFQDALGTTPVTAVEQPVGLILDKRFGVARGPELGWVGTLSVAAFGNTTGYTITDLGDRIRITATAATTGPHVDTPLSVVAGSYHEVVLEVMAVSQGAMAFYGATNGGAETAFSNTYKTTSGVYSQIARLSGNGNGKLRIFLAPARSNTPTAALAGDYIEVSKTISVREVPGNHASQVTTTARPILSARRNLLVKTESLDDAVWVKNDASVVASGYIGQTGIAAFNLIESASEGIHRATQLFPVVAGITYRYSFFAKPAGRQQVSLYSWASGGNTGTVTFNIFSGTVSGVSEFTDITATPVGDGWFKCEASFVPNTSSNREFQLRVGVLAPYLGDGIKGVTVGGFQVEAGKTSTRYQRVNTATDYDTVGFPHYLRFDGVDDFLQTGNIDFTTTDKTAVVAGVRKLSDAARGVVVELGNNQANSFMVDAPVGPSPAADYRFISRGSAVAEAASADGPFNATHTGVLTGIGDISGDSAILRVDGAQVVMVTTDQGTGNYGNYPLYIGRRGGTTFPFNGHLYQLGIRGVATTDDLIQAWEKAVAKKTGVRL